MKIDRISKYGLVTVDFSQALFIPANITHVNSTVLEVQITAANEEWQGLMGFTWEIEAFNNKQLSLKMTFEHPQQISTDLMESDMLSIRVLKPTKFLSKTTFQTIRDETVIDLKIPRQIKPTDQEVLQLVEAQADQIGGSTSVLMGGSFAINLLLAGSLSLLWGLIHALQLVTHLPLLNVQFPDTTKVYYEAMLQIATLDLVPTDDLEEVVDEEVGKADHSEESFDLDGILSHSTLEAGYDNANIVLNSTFNLLTVAAIVVFLLLIMALRLLCSRCDRIKGWLTKIWRAIFWNFIIRTMMETYLELVIANMIKMHAVKFQTWFETVGSTIAIVALAILTIFGLTTPIFLYCKRDALKKPEFIAKYGSLTIDLKMTTMLHRFYVFFFTVRRLIFAAMIVFFAR